MKKSNVTLKEFVKMYKWHILLWMIGLIFLGNYVYQKVTSPTTLLNGILLGAERGETIAEEIGADFAESIGYKDTVYALKLDTQYSYMPGDKSHSKENYQATQAIVSQIEKKRLDFVAGPTESLLDIAYNSQFAELTTTLSPGQLEMLKPHLLYIDGAVLEELETAFENKEDTSKITLPDPTKPEEMEKPIAVMFDVSNCEEFMKIYADSANTLAFGMISSAPNDDILRKFIGYLME